MDTQEGPAPPPEDTQPAPKEDFDQSAGRRARRLVGATLAVTAAIAAGGDQPKHSSGPEVAPSPKYSLVLKTRLSILNFWLPMLWGVLKKSFDSCARTI